MGSNLSTAVAILLAIGLSAQEADPEDKKADSAPVFKAGSSVVDITPPKGLPMWGYGARHALPADGVHDPLYAASVVLEVGERKLALIGLDLGRSPARRTIARIKERARRDAGVTDVYLVGSHTHHGPCLELESVEPTSKYIDELVEKLSRGIADAATAARPARLGVGRAETKLNRNRHTKIEPKPVDRELVVIRLDDLDGKPIATVVNFAAHPTTRSSRMLKYSADFPGPMRERVEKRFGGQCVFLQGAGGDLSANLQGRTTDEFGAALADEVIAVYESITPAVPRKPSIETREEEFRFDVRVNLEDPITYTMYCLAFFKDLVDAYVEEYRDGLRPLLNVALLNGEIGIVCGSGEFFSSHSIRLKSRSRLPHTLFLGYCNGYHQYFPTIEAAAEGGYGADPQVSPAEVGAGERILDRALFHLYDMQKRFKGLRQAKAAEEK